ncbi:hypothetical protein CLAIMM_10234 [Cladophialophora immunda]|nr:hypothetical protein CLAIMM_10234 [Cladophialophora immunda]
MLTGQTGNARLAGFEKDLHLTGYDFNRILTVFFVSYIAFEMPATFICKLIGPGWFLPSTTLGFGVMTLCMGYVHGKSTAYAVRFLLGLFEAGMLPGIAYYLSRWYRRSELTFRLAMVMSMSPVSGAFGGLLASGILKLSRFGNVRTWRMIFAVEGVISIGIALMLFLLLTDRPATARWLDKEEKGLAIARIKSERIASTEVLDKLDRPKVIRGITSPVTLAVGLSFCLAGITIQGLSVFLPTIVKTIYPETTTVEQQLRTAPPFVVAAFMTILYSYLSYRTGRRQIFLILSAPLIIIGYAMFLGTTHTQAQVRYGATFLIAMGCFPFVAFVNAQVSANIVSDTARAAAIGTCVLFGNAGGLISTWTYLPTDAPEYHIGNGINLATSSVLLLLSVGLLVFMLRDNHRREKKDVDSELAGLSQKQMQDLEWKHPAFRWLP